MSIGLNGGGDVDEHEVRLKGNKFYARVVDNNDPMKQQRVKVRISSVHGDTEDGGLPWAVKAGGVSGTDSIGDIDVPVRGSWVWVTFMDHTPYKPQYVPGAYVGGSIIEELVNEDYPHVTARIDRSGNLWKTNTKTDEVSLSLVSGALVHFDGAGRLVVKTADNTVGPDATSPNPPGLTLVVIGNIDAQVTGNTVISSQGNTTIATEGNADVSAGGNGRLVAAGNVDVSAGGSASVKAGGSAVLSASGAVNIDGALVNVNCGSPSNPSSPTAPLEPDEPTARSRPDEPGFDGQDTY